MFNLNKWWLGPDSDSLSDGFDSLFSVKSSEIPAPSPAVESKLFDLQSNDSRDYTQQAKKENNSMDSLFGTKITNNTSNHLEAVKQRTKSMNIIVVEPKNFEDSLEIVKNLKQRNTVIVNLQYLDNEASQRVIDFVSGAAVAMDGSYERVGSGVFIFAPINCNVSSNHGNDIYSELFNKTFAQA
ncbi:MAG: cell division protein SepF [Candidatus Caenarcaniphilales bacterium]|nr:cell division protein SepF [Candidatus Caenarcaniphilales bacterium]